MSVWNLSRNDSRMEKELRRISPQSILCVRSGTDACHRPYQTGNARPYSSTRSKHTSQNALQPRSFESTKCPGKISRRCKPRQRLAPTSPSPLFPDPTNHFCSSPTSVSSPFDICSPRFYIHHLQRSSRHKIRSSNLKTILKTMKPTLIVILSGLLATAMALPTAKQPNMFPAEDKSGSDSAERSPGVNVGLLANVPQLQALYLLTRSISHRSEMATRR